MEFWDNGVDGRTVSAMGSQWDLTVQKPEHVSVISREMVATSVGVL